MGRGPRIAPQPLDGTGNVTIELVPDRGQDAENSETRKKAGAKDESAILRARRHQREITGNPDQRDRGKGRQREEEKDPEPQ